MAQRVNVLWGILVTLLAACVIWIGYGNYSISRKIDSMGKQRITLGTDEQLKETVNTLEKNLNDRLAYVTKVESDPLDLTKVIQSKSFLASLGLKETIEQQGRMRLSATIISEVPSAVVKFMGRSNIVHQGEIFNGFLVEKITKQSMIMTKGGARLVLINESAPEGELSESGSSITGKNY